uniref:DNA polymerase III subunit delta n=2 Tax=Aquisalinus luteolus TaxID=1566827 RepID=A0A8J3A2U6_9PROT|nr:DNA polymerase III subunit delta' [Aquisalinus luteolus]
MANQMAETEEHPYPSPEQRLNLAGHMAAETRLRQLLDEGALSNGWMLAGPQNVGKATLAYRLARAFLDRQSLTGTDGLATSDSKSAHLVAQKAHPDLFIAERQWDEKKDRLVGEITVDTIRQMIAFMGRTSGSGYRVAIVDSADDLNRNAANALLKVLEEPPANALVILLTSAPGRLLPTIRSRCRVLTLKPLEGAEVAAFLETEGAASGDKALALAQAAAGRPGFALQLAAGEGADALAAAVSFIKGSLDGRGLAALADRMALKSAEPMWDSFKAILLRQLSTAATALATGEPLPQQLSAFQGRSPGKIAEAWEEISNLIARAEALNTNRTQIVLGMGAIMKKQLKGA